jgi:hypothetical protein
MTQTHSEPPVPQQHVSSLQVVGQAPAGEFFSNLGTVVLSDTPKNNWTSHTNTFSIEIDGND